MNSDRWFHNNGRGARVVGHGPNYCVKFDKDSGRPEYYTRDLCAAIADVKAYVDGRCVVAIRLENGNGWTTAINTDYRGALDYYYGADYFEQPDESVSVVAAVSLLNEAGSFVEVVTREEYHNKIGKVFRNFI